MPEQFKKDVVQGLSHFPKTLPSKYFYDKAGDALFVQIMKMPEYYLTRAEHEIFTEQSEQLIQAFQVAPDQHFELIELGAGDGTKTSELLKVLIRQNHTFDYLPIDISQHALDQLEQRLNAELPGITIRKKQGDYFTMLASLRESPHPKVLFFLGSNIGNMTDQQATEFIYKLGSNLRPGDKLLLGVDLIKPTNIVLPAYNDEAGLTSAFNLNLLLRINKELDGDFNINSFSHKAEYTAETGIAQSYLVSTVDQTITLNGSANSFHFMQGEKVLTEVSRKYDDQIINRIIRHTDFQIIQKLTDRRDYFADYIFKRV
jgi:L-histidine N-alpha-methyltransferase